MPGVTRRYDKTALRISLLALIGTTMGALVIAAPSPALGAAQESEPSVAPRRTPELHSPTVNEDLAAELARIKLQLDAQSAEIARLRAAGDRGWIDEQRAEEIRALVQDVLADADLRASLVQNGLTAGYDKHFFIGSADGNFLLQLYMKLQTRFVYNHRDAAPGEDGERWGFEQRRTELYWNGHVISPDLTYKVKIAANRSGGSVRLDDAIIGYRLNDVWKVDVGQFKVPFLREFLMSSGRQQAVERSYINHVFNANRSQGIQLKYGADRWTAMAMVHDGTGAKNSAFASDRTDLALAARGELLLAGEWSQFKDFASWSDEGFGLLLGAAVDYEVGETGFGTDTADFLKYTVDLGAEFGGWNLFAAFVGQHVQDNGSTGFAEVDQIGFLVQGGIFVIPDKLDVFARYEHLDLDGVLYNAAVSSMTPVADDKINLVTVGMNYYFKKHTIKLTTDLIWVLDPLPDSDTGAGLLRSSEDDQIVFRTQIQLMF